MANTRNPTTDPRQRMVYQMGSAYVQAAAPDASYLLSAGHAVHTGAAVCLRDRHEHAWDIWYDAVLHVVQGKLGSTLAGHLGPRWLRIYATTITAAHGMMRKGLPFIGRLFIGLTRPTNPILGTEVGGTIEAVGKDVKLFKAGDHVFGETGVGGGCYAEYLCLSEGEPLSIKPANLTYGEAAAILDGASTALYFLRDKANIQRIQSVLINGASGSVGTAAVQLARYFGANVTGVCSTGNLELVQLLGADIVIDYTKEDFTKTG